MMRFSVGILAAILGFLAACQVEHAVAPPSPDSSQQGLSDAGFDAGLIVDSGRDTGSYADHDVGLDSGNDASPDAAYDAGLDAAYNAGLDAGVDPLDATFSDSALSCPAAADCTGLQCGADPVCGISCGICATGFCSTGLCLSDPVYSCDQPENLTCGDHIVHAASIYTNRINMYLSCGASGQNWIGAEVAFAFCAEQTGIVTVDLSQFSGDLDLSVYGPGCDGNVCLGKSWSESGNEHLNLQVTEGDCMTLIVDGYQSEVGSFTLDVDCREKLNDAGTDSGYDAGHDAGNDAGLDAGINDTAVNNDVTLVDSSVVDDAGSSDLAEPGCVDICTSPRALTCSSSQSAILECRDMDGDGCLEWTLLHRCASTQTCDDAACVSTCTGPSPCREEIVISEIHYDPDAASDINGEYIELYNRSNHSVDLNGCSLSDENSSHVFSAFVIPSQGYGLVGRSNVISENGGIEPDVIVQGLDLRLNNRSFETLTLECGFTMDVVEFPYAHPGGTGVSLQLDPSYLQQEKTDFPLAWCDSTQSYGAGDLGTPGTANDSCFKSIVFFDDLEKSAWTDPRWTRGSTGFQADALCNWEWGQPADQGYYYSQECNVGGYQCLTTDLDLWAWNSMTYDQNWVQLGPLDLSSLNPASTIDFYFQMGLNLPADVDDQDHAQVVISSDGLFYSRLLIDNIPYDDPADEPVQWEHSRSGMAHADLTPWIGEQQVYLRWQEETDRALNGKGLFIDNVWILER